MSIVLFLGAGTSVDAGYPLAGNLLKEMDNYYKDNSLITTPHRNWEDFQKFRDRPSDTILHGILNSPNPELVLTIPDLLETALNEGDYKAWSDLREAINGGMNEAEINRVNSWWKSSARKPLEEAYLAKKNFLYAVQHFFYSKHYDDNRDLQKATRDYLCTGFKALQEGDVIITTNWDTLAERVLMEQEKWFPDDGYGFDVFFEREPAHPSKVPARKETKIKVLKLHGSLGWHNGDSKDSLYLRSANFLQHFPDYSDLRDKKESGIVGPPINPVFVVPSYLKQLEGSTMQSIWNQAAEALSCAVRIFFIGYSLPEADVAIRTLVNPIRRRLEEGKVEVTVVDPDEIVYSKYRKFFGADVLFKESSAKDAFCSNIIS